MQLHPKEKQVLPSSLGDEVTNVYDYLRSKEVSHNDVSYFAAIILQKRLRHQRHALDLLFDS
jgi:hypothetical protein